MRNAPGFGLIPMDPVAPVGLCGSPSDRAGSIGRPAATESRTRDAVGMAADPSATVAEAGRRRISEGQTPAAPRFTRRTVMSLLASLPLVGTVTPRGGGSRLGWPDGLGLTGLGEDGPNVLRLPSVAALRDHLAAGLVDVALMPLSTPSLAFVAVPVPGPPAEAWLLVGPARTSGASVLARPAADRNADAALRALWIALGAGDAPELLALAPVPACANAAAGHIDGALVFGAAPPVPPGCRLLWLGRTAALRPVLGLARANFAKA